MMEVKEGQKFTRRDFLKFCLILAVVTAIPGSNRVEQSTDSGPSLREVLITKLGRFMAERERDFKLEDAPRQEVPYCTHTDEEKNNEAEMVTVLAEKEARGEFSKKHMNPFGENIRVLSLVFGSDTHYELGNPGDRRDNRYWSLLWGVVHSLKHKQGGILSRVKMAVEDIGEAASMSRDSMGITEGLEAKADKDDLDPEGLTGYELAVNMSTVRHIVSVVFDNILELVGRAVSAELRKLQDYNPEAYKAVYIHLGDVVHDGRTWLDYLYGISRVLGVSDNFDAVSIIPGNHDVDARLVHPIQKVTELLGSQQYIQDTEEWAVWAVDSTLYDPLFIDFMVWLRRNSPDEIPVEIFKVFYEKAQIQFQLYERIRESEGPVLLITHDSARVEDAGTSYALKTSFEELNKLEAEDSELQAVKQAVIKAGGEFDYSLDLENTSVELVIDGHIHIQTEDTLGVQNRHGKDIERRRVGAHLSGSPEVVPPTGLVATISGSEVRISEVTPDKERFTQVMLRYFRDEDKVNIESLDEVSSPS